MRKLWITAAAIVVLLATGVEVLGSGNTRQQPLKEPQYRSTTPLYCKLVFGIRGTSSFWMVRDGEHLYFDHNGNRDLTDDQDRLTTNTTHVTFPDQGTIKPEFLISEVSEDDGATKHQLISVDSTPELGMNMHMVKVWKTNGKRLEYAVASFSEQIDEAPTIHFNGRLVIRINKRHTDVLVTGESPSELYAYVTTEPEDKGVTGAQVSYYAGGVPLDVHPVVELDFQNKTSGAPAIRTTVPLAKRC